MGLGTASVMSDFPSFARNYGGFAHLIPVNAYSAIRFALPSEQVIVHHWLGLH